MNNIIPMYRNSSPKVICTAFAASSLLLVARCVYDGCLKKISGEEVDKDVNKRLLIRGPLVCKRWSVVHRALQDCSVIDAVPSPCLPFKGGGAKQRWDVLEGRLVVVVDLEAHVLNEGNILRPILGMEDEVHDFFSPLVNCDGGGGRFGCRRFPPNLAGSMLFQPNP